MFIFIWRGQNSFCRFLWRCVSQWWDSVPALPQCRAEDPQRTVDAAEYIGVITLVIITVKDFSWGEDEIKPFPNEMHALMTCETFHSVCVAAAKVLNLLQMWKFSWKPYLLIALQCYAKKSLQRLNDQVTHLGFPLVLDHLTLCYCWQIHTGL